MNSSPVLSDASTMAMRPAATRPGLRRAGWIALSVLSVLVITFAIRTSPSFHSAPPPAADLPFQRPPLAAHLVTTTDVRSTLGVETVELQDRPPRLKLWTSNSPMAADLRNSSLVGAWQREWSSADRARYVMVVAIEVTKPQYLTVFRGQCAPATATTMPATVAAVRAGFIEDQNDLATFCIVSEAGNLSVFTVVAVRGTSATALASSAAQHLAIRQLDLAAAYGSASTVVHSTHYARDSINRWLILAAIVAPLLLFLPITLIDRATWRRLRRRFRRRSVDDPFVVSVDPAARLALSEATALALVKVAVYVWLLRASDTFFIGTYETAALLLLAFCVMSFAESRILRRGRGRYSPRPFRGASRLLAVGGLTLTAAAVAAAFLVADASLSLASLGFNPVGADYINARLGSVGVVASLFVLALAVLPLMLVRRLAMRRLRREARNSPGRHIVLLRSFVDDKRRVRARRLGRASIIDRLCLRRWERFEEVIATALSTIGPVIALSRPGERLPPALGAVRQQFAMDAWQEGVRDLIRDSALVCMVVGRTQSLVIELGEIKRLGALRRTLFLIPPCDRPEQRRRLALLSRELGIPWNRMVQATRGRDALLIVPNLDPGHALIFTGRAPDDVGYEAAVNAAALLLKQPVQPTAAVCQLVADLHSRASGVGPTTPTTSPQPPAVHVYPPGKAPAYKPLYRKLRAVQLMMVSVGSVITAVFSFVVGINIDDHPGVPTGSGTATSLAEDDVTGGLFAVVDGRQIAAIDLAKHTAHLVGTAPVYLDDLIVHGNTAYGDTPVPGTVAAVDLTTHRPLWTVQLPPSVKGLALAGDLLVTTVPAEHQLVAMSARDGHLVVKRAIDGLPWGVVASGNRFVVPIVDRGQLAYLTTADLSPAETVATVSGPQEVFSQGTMLWVLAPTEDRAVRRYAEPTDPGNEGQLLLTDPDARASASSNWFAVQGNERITLVSTAGLILRVPLPFAAISSICVTRDGHLFIGVEGAVDQLR